MIGYGRQSIDSSDVEAVVAALNGDLITQGPLCEKFEARLGQFLGASCVKVVSSGTAALHLAGIALGWKPGDLVITSPVTFVATANAIVYSGATPDFVDINLDTYAIDLNKLEEKLLEKQKMGVHIKAIIAVDYAGHPADWENLRYLADKYEIQLINDNCHALGAKYKGNIDYAARYADLVTLSFHPVKQITTGEGGGQS